MHQRNFPGTRTFRPSFRASLTEQPQAIPGLGLQSFPQTHSARGAICVITSVRLGNSMGTDFEGVPSDRGGRSIGAPSAFMGVWLILSEANADRWTVVVNHGQVARGSNREHVEPALVVVTDSDVTARRASKAIAPAGPSQRTALKRLISRKQNMSSHAEQLIDEADTVRLESWLDAISDGEVPPELREE